MQHGAQGRFLIRRHPFRFSARTADCRAERHFVLSESNWALPESCRRGSLQSLRAELATGKPTIVKTVVKRFGAGLIKQS